MILIEAINISEGGAFVLLRQLVSDLENQGINFHVLIGEKCPPLSVKTNAITVEPSNSINRREILKRQVKLLKPKSILCFGNFPLPFKYKFGKVYTYFHRPHLTGQTDQSNHSLKEKVIYSLKRIYLQSLLGNSDYFIFQSGYIRDLFLNRYNYDKNQTLIIPFYDEEKIDSIGESFEELSREDAFIYVSNDAPHKNHQKLLDAWNLLRREGKTPKLYLTLPNNSPFEQKVIELNRAGGQIVNLGFIPYIDVLKKTYSVKYAIFPSLAETLGLGLVEAAKMGTKVLASDLPFTYEVISPSLVFDPKDILSIVNAVKSVDKEKEIKETRVILTSKIDELIKTLTA